MQRFLSHSGVGSGLPALVRIGSVPSSSRGTRPKLPGVYIYIYISFNSENLKKLKTKYL